MMHSKETGRKGQTKGTGVGWKNWIRSLGFGFVSLLASGAHAQTPGNTSPGWDYKNPTNVTESREYARLFYECQESGVISPEFSSFRFTNPAPNGTMTPFYGTEVLFDKLYAHRLDYRVGSPTYYTLDDLRRDDPDVEAAFRLYATTGKIETSIVGDADLLIKHLEAINDAASAAADFSFASSEQFDVVDDELESVGLLATSDDSGPAIAAMASQSNAAMAAIKRILPTFPNGTPPYWPDGEKPCTGNGPDDGMSPNDGFCLSPGHPGFDCDDYARAWAAWLKRHLTEYPNAEYFVLYVYYGNPPKGHAVVAILIDGQYYLLDPQTGEVVGPIEEGNWFSPTDFAPGLKKLLEPYDQNPGNITWKKHPPDYIDPNEPKPWYEDPEVLDWWRRMFPGMDPNDFIWPTN